MPSSYFPAFILKTAENNTADSDPVKTGPVAMALCIEEKVAHVVQITGQKRKY